MLVIKKAKPLFTGVITTMNMLEEKDMYIKGTNLLDSSRMNRSVSEYQTVLAIGSHVNEIKVGDLVCVNPIRFGRPTQKRKAGSIKENMEEYTSEVQYQFDIIEMDGKPCLKLQDRDIDYIVEEYEEIEDFNPIPTIVTEEHLRPKINLDLN